jgi:hypothetical protein
MPKKQKLIAGAILQFDFPKLPETLFAMCQQENKPVARMQVSLPTNYNLDKSFPIMVFLHGGAGTQGTICDAEYVRCIVGDKDIIGVSLPLFKKETDPQEVHGGILIQAYDDYPIISKCYQVMLTQLFSVVPNIAHGQGTIGGFSNGGHTTALLLSAVDPFIIEHFNNFYLIDGGIIITSGHKTAIKNKNFLIMVGGSRKEKERRMMLNFVENGYRHSKKMGVSCKLVKMPGVEHAFPDEYISTLQKWVRKMLQLEMK